MSQRSDSIHAHHILARIQPIRMFNGHLVAVGNTRAYRRSQDMILRHGGAEVRRSVHAGQRRKPATVEAITELTVHLIHVELSFNCATMALL